MSPSVLTPEDQEHLKLLSVFQYIFGTFTAILSFIPVFHLAAGLLMVVIPCEFESVQAPESAWVGWLFICIATVFILIGLCLSIAIILTGYFLQKRKHPTFCLIVSGIECLCIPLGTILGIFTLLVLNRDSVRKAFY